MGGMVFLINGEKQFFQSVATGFINETSDARRIISEFELLGEATRLGEIFAFLQRTDKLEVADVSNPQVIYKIFSAKISQVIPGSINPLFQKLNIQLEHQSIKK